MPQELQDQELVAAANVAIMYAKNYGAKSAIPLCNKILKRWAFSKGDACSSSYNLFTVHCLFQYLSLRRCFRNHKMRIEGLVLLVELSLQQREIIKKFPYTEKTKTAGKILVFEPGLPKVLADCLELLWRKKKITLLEQLLSGLRRGNYLEELYYDYFFKVTLWHLTNAKTQEEFTERFVIYDKLYVGEYFKILTKLTSDDIGFLGVKICWIYDSLSSYLEKDNISWERVIDQTPAVLEERIFAFQLHYLETLLSFYNKSQFDTEDLKIIEGKVNTLFIEIFNYIKNNKVPYLRLNFYTDFSSGNAGFGVIYNIGRILCLLANYDIKKMKALFTHMLLLSTEWDYVYFLALALDFQKQLEAFDLDSIGLSIKNIFCIVSYFLREGNFQCACDVLLLLHRGKFFSGQNKTPATYLTITLGKRVFDLEIMLNQVRALASDYQEVKDPVLKALLLCYEGIFRWLASGFFPLGGSVLNYTYDTIEKALATAGSALGRPYSIGLETHFYCVRKNEFNVSQLPEQTEQDSSLTKYGL